MSGTGTSSKNCSTDDTILPQPPWYQRYRVVLLFSVSIIAAFAWILPLAFVLWSPFQSGREERGTWPVAGRSQEGPATAINVMPAELANVSICVKAPMGSPASAVLCKLHNVIYMPNNLTWNRSTGEGNIILHAKSGEWTSLAPKTVISKQLYLHFKDDSDKTIMMDGSDLPTYDLVVVWNRGHYNLCTFVKRWPRTPIYTRNRYQHGVFFMVTFNEAELVI